MKIGIVMAAAVASAMACSHAALAQAVQWRVEDGGNGHWYQRGTFTTSDVSFSAAQALAAEAGGELATVHSLLENDFIRDLNAMQFRSYWLGGVQVEPSCSGLGCEWRWLTGEAWKFENWCCGGVDNDVSNEDCLASSQDGLWNSIPCNGGPGMEHYMLEWSADCNNDGIVDYGQIRDGLLADSDRNNIPDSCEPGMAGWVVLADSSVAYSNEQGLAGWRYRYDSGDNTAVLDMLHFVPAPLPVGDTVWCVEPAFGRGGSHCAIGQVWMHTATVSDCASPGQLLRPRRLWSSMTPVSGRVVLSGSFLSHHGTRSRLTLLVDGAVAYEQISSGNATTGIEDWERIGASIPISNCSTIELLEDPEDSSCHADGTLCLVQVIVEDCNGDGIPDPCGLHVPQDYPTIQAAIDAVPAATAGVVLVAAGTYNESFALTGKDVIVRGAAKNATILDGTGLTTAIATFSGNEPATAGVENLVFRNGTSGSEIAPPGTGTRGGGGVYGRNSSAHITDCRFEDCHSEYGGGVYLLDCAVAWSGCVFDGNSCDGDGGGAMVYRSSGTVSNCTFTDNRSGLIASGAGSGFKAVGAGAVGETIELTDCMFTGNVASVSGSAIEYYHNAKWNPGVMRLSGCTITNNQSGIAVVTGAAGLRVLGPMDCCFVTNSTTICDNLSSNVSGPYFIEGAVTICDCAGDLTGDGAVNGADLGVALSAWGLTQPNGTGDIDHDGFVNAADLSILLSNWGSCN